MCGYIISYQGFWLEQDSKPISRSPKSKWSALDLESGLPRTWLGRSLGFLVGGLGATKCWKTSNQLLKDRYSMFFQGVTILMWTRLYYHNKWFPNKKTQKLWRTCFDEEETAHDQRPVFTLIGETLSIPLLSMKTWPLPGSHYLSLAETRHGSRFNIFSGVICWYNIVKRGGDQS